MRAFFLLTVLIKASMALPPPADELKGFSEVREELQAVGKKYTDHAGVPKYAIALKEDVDKAEEAAKKGDLKNMAATLRRLAADSEEGKYFVEFNERLFQLASKTLPSDLSGLERSFEAGVRDLRSC